MSLANFHSTYQFPVEITEKKVMARRIFTHADLLWNKPGQHLAWNNGRIQDGRWRSSPITGWPPSSGHNDRDKRKPLTRKGFEAHE